VIFSSFARFAWKCTAGTLSVPEARLAIPRLAKPAASRTGFRDVERPHVRYDAKRRNETNRAGGGSVRTKNAPSVTGSYW